MLLTLNHSDGRPLYEQIAASIRASIASGELEAGERLPSGRDLAQATGVTLETVQRAYRLLKDEGIVISRVGRGTSVAENISAETLSITAQIDELIAAAKLLDLDQAALAQLILERK